MSSIPVLRPVQTAIEEAYEHPVGPVPESLMLGDNAALLAALAPLYLTGAGAKTTRPAHS